MQNRTAWCCSKRRRPRLSLWQRGCLVVILPPFAHIQPRLVGRRFPVLAGQCTRCPSGARQRSGPGGERVLLHDLPAASRTPHRACMIGLWFASNPQRGCRSKPKGNSLTTNVTSPAFSKCCGSCAPHSSSSTRQASQLQRGIPLQPQGLPSQCGSS